MMDQEQVHLNYFTEIMARRRVRPTLLIPFWRIGGYLMGIASGLSGFKPSMLVTEAVEEVIEEHYQQQIDYLTAQGADKELLTQLQQFQLQEIEHKNEAVAAGSQNVLSHSFWTGIVKAVCRGAIYLSKKI